MPTSRGSALGKLFNVSKCSALILLPRGRAHAGLAGAQMALASLKAEARAPILNLRSVNSYVAGSWEEWTNQMRVQNSAARQPGPGCSICQGPSSAGRRL